MSSAHKSRNGWTQALTATFNALVEMGATDEEIAAAVGRSVHSVRCKRDVQAGRHYLCYRQTFGPSFEIPPRRKNDCARHVAMIAHSHGTGFPILTIHPAYRVAA